MTKLAGEIAAESGQELLLLNPFSDMNNETTQSSLFLGLLTRLKRDEGVERTIFYCCTLSQNKNIIIYTERPTNQPKVYPNPPDQESLRIK